MKLTIEQLADKVNELISEKFKEQPESIKDGRQSSTLSTRRIRDYITKGLIEKPVGAGREKWFDNSHIDALVSLRLLQHNGLSDYYIKNSLSATSTEIDNDSFPGIEEKYSKDALTSSDMPSNDEVMQNNALDFLKSLQGNNNPKKISPINEMAIANNPINKSFLSSIDSKAYANQADTDLLKSLSQTKYRQFNEYMVDEKLGVFLKIDSRADLELQKKLTEVIKNEIIKHNKENNND